MLTSLFPTAGGTFLEGSVPSNKAKITASRSHLHGAKTRANKDPFKTPKKKRARKKIKVLQRESRIFTYSDPSETVLDQTRAERLTCCAYKETNK
jgi:hypothetical protein